MAKENKQRVAVVLGGQSTEHQVSLVSGFNVFKAIPRDKYDVELIKITRNGQWSLIENADNLNAPEELEPDMGIQVLTGDPESRGFFKLDQNEDSVMVKPMPIDVVFPVLHGPLGEDGTLQGLLQMADLPYVGCGVLASSVAMDKVFSKQLFFQNDLDTSDFMWFLRNDWKSTPKLIRKAVASEIGYPCFVKPANAGSSVGVSKVHTEDDLDVALNKAAEYDRKILVEKAIDARELECAILGNEQPLASIVGEIIPAHEFYDYEAKYHNDASELIIPANISKDLEERIQKTAIAAFKALDGSGMARVDFLLEKNTGHLYLNEINTIPGFTSISMYTKLWEASGIRYGDLLDRLIQLAILRHEDMKQSNSIFHTNTF